MVQSRFESTGDWVLRTIARLETELLKALLRRREALLFVLEQSVSRELDPMAKTLIEKDLAHFMAKYRPDTDDKHSLSEDITRQILAEFRRGEYATSSRP